MTHYRVKKLRERKLKLARSAGPHLPAGNAASSSVQGSPLVDSTQAVRKYVQALRSTRVGGFDWHLVDPRLMCGMRVRLLKHAAPVLDEWEEGRGRPIAGGRRAGMLGTVVDYHDADSMRFMSRLYNLGHPNNVPWVRVLFDDAPTGFDGQTPIFHAESLPAAVCRVLQRASIPGRHVHAAEYAVETERRQLADASA